MDTQQLYEQYIEPLPRDERQRLLEWLARDLANREADEGGAEHSLLEFEGLGAEVWEGVDPQQYVNSLRAEWDSRP